MAKQNRIPKRWQKRCGAATEHTGEPQLAAAYPSKANVVFVNIDWKKNRMYATLDANMQKLANLIKNIVNNMNPTVICMCEVGEVKHPLDSGQMQKVADAAILAWKVAATEHIQLRSMFTTGAPYITLYINGPIQCSEHRILRNLYQARDGLPRTAQALSLIHI